MPVPHPCVRSCNLPLLMQEIEISSSGSETGTANKTNGGGDSNDSDSDFEEALIGRGRKRTREEVLDKNKDRPASGRQKPKKPGTVTRAISKRSSNSDDAGSLHGAGESAPSDGARKMRKMDEESGGEGDFRGGDDASGGGANSVKSVPFPVFGGQAIPAEGESSPAVFSADSFDLNEDENRRSSFQAGLKAALPDDHRPSVAGQEEGGGGGVESGHHDGPSTATAQASNPGPSSSRGKGKGKGAAAKVKLTPMEQQVVDLKEKHPGVLLLVECGYRYRFFGDDALAAAKVGESFACAVHDTFCASSTVAMSWGIELPHRCGLMYARACGTAFMLSCLKGGAWDVRALVSEFTSPLMCPSSTTRFFFGSCVGAADLRAHGSQLPGRFGAHVPPRGAPSKAGGRGI